MPVENTIKPYVIVDIDGTVADSAWRLAGEKKNYTFISYDAPFEDIRQLLKDVEKGRKIIYITARREEQRQETARWIMAHNLPYYNILLMRPKGDERKDYEIKSDYLDHYGFTPDNTYFVLEDRDQVVKMYRERGFRVLQVKDGNY